MVADMLLCRCCCPPAPAKGHPKPQVSWSRRVAYMGTASLLLASVAAIVTYIVFHVTDTGMSLGREAVTFKDPSRIKASVFASDQHHEAAMVAVARSTTLCNTDIEVEGWSPKCRVLMAYESFAGRISKEAYVQAFQAKKLPYKMVDKPGGMFQKYTAEMNWDPTSVTPANYMDVKFHHQHYGELKLWSLASWAVCAREERSLSEIDASPELYIGTIREELYQYAASIEWAIKQLEDFRPDVVILAQGHYHFAAGLRAAAILQGLHVIALETPFNNRRLVWSTISGLSVDRGVEKNLFWRYQEFVKPEQAKAEVLKYFEIAKSSKMMVHSTPENREQLDEWLSSKPRGQKIIMYAAQVFTDTAVILNLNRGFESQAHVIWTLADWCVKHNQPLVVKFHPRETPPKDLFPIYGPRLNHLTLRRLRELYEWDRLVEDNPTLLLTDNTNALDTYAILDIADAVVTINSGTGLEGLLRNKEVILAGNAYYGGLGFTHHPAGPNELTATVKDVLAGKLKLNSGNDSAKFFFIFNRWATVPKRAEAIVDRACGFPGRWPLPKTQFCEDGNDDQDLGTLT